MTLQPLSPTRAGVLCVRFPRARRAKDSFIFVLTNSCVLDYDGERWLLWATMRRVACGFVLQPFLQMMKKMRFLCLGGLVCAAFAVFGGIGDADPALARKSGGAPERLLEKQGRKGASQNQPTPTESRLVRKQGGDRSRLLRQRRCRLG